MGTSAARDDPEFQILHDASPQIFFEIGENVGCEDKQLALPDLIFDFDNQARPHHAGGASMAGDFRADSLPPGRARQIFRGNSIGGQVQPSNELAGSLHVRGRNHSSTRGTTPILTAVRSHPLTGGKTAGATVKMVLVLASQSPRRAEILRLAGIPFTVRVVAVDETPRPGEVPEQYVCRLAEEKAMAVDAAATETVLAADTTVVSDGEMLAKPANAADARRMLEILSGRVHQVLTGICLRRNAQRRSDYASTRVWFNKMTSDEVASYVASGEPMDKAGGYAIQGLASKYIEKIDGCYFNVVGLPIALVYRHLKDIAAI